MTTTHRPLRFRRMAAATALALFLAPVAGACSASGDDDADDQVTTEANGEETDDTEDVDGEDEDSTTTVDDDDDTTTTTESRGSRPIQDDEAAMEAFVEGAASELANDPSLNMDRTQAECTAVAWAETLGPERITDPSLNAQNVARGDTELAGQMVDGMTGCGLDLDQMMHDELTVNQGLSQSQADCVIAELPSDALRDLIALEMAGELQGDDDPIVDTFFQAGVACSDA